MKLYLFLLLIGIAHILSSCTTDAQRRRAERDAGAMLRIGGTVASVAGHPEYGIPAKAVGGLLIKDSGK